MLLYVLLAAFVLTAVVAGCSSTSASPKAPPPPPKAKPKIQLKDVTKVGDPKAPVKVVAYFPLTGEHVPVAEYLTTLPEKFGGKVYVEVYDMQSEKGREKWGTTGLQCAGVFINGKINWDVTRAGKPAKISFVKRPPVLWTYEDLEALIKSQLKDPKAVPDLPAPKKPAAKPPAKPAAKPAEKGK